MSLHQRHLDIRQPLEIDDHLAGIGDALARLDHIRHALVSTVVHRNDGAVHGHRVQSCIHILHLPHPPETVERGVVEVEYGVAGRRVGVSARVDGVDVMA